MFKASSSGCCGAIEPAKAAPRAQGRCRRGAAGGRRRAGRRGGGLPVRHRARPRRPADRAGDLVSERRTADRATARPLHPERRVLRGGFRPVAAADRHFARHRRRRRQPLRHRDRARRCRVRRRRPIAYRRQLQGPRPQLHPAQLHRPAAPSEPGHRLHAQHLGRPRPARPGPDRHVRPFRRRRHHADRDRRHARFRSRRCSAGIIRTIGAASAPRNARPDRRRGRPTKNRWNGITTLASKRR